MIFLLDSYKINVFFLTDYSKRTLFPLEIYKITIFYQFIRRFPKHFLGNFLKLTLLWKFFDVNLLFINITTIEFVIYSCSIVAIYEKLINKKMVLLFLIIFYRGTLSKNDLVNHNMKQLFIKQI